MKAISSITNNQVGKTISFEANNTQSSTNLDSAKTLKSDTFSKTNKTKVALASLAGGAVGAGIGLVSSYNLWQKIIHNQLYASYGKSSLDKKLVDAIGELVVKHLQGEKITGIEGYTFFKERLSSKATIAMEEFIKNNNLTSNSNPKEVKKLLKEFVVKDDAMKEYIDEFKNHMRYEAVTKELVNKPLAMAKYKESIFIQKLGNSAIKKYAAITAAAVAVGTVVAGGITALILKQKNKSDSSQMQ